MSKQVKDISPKKPSRTRIRPDDDDILDKLRVKRSVSIPLIDLEDDFDAPEPKTEPETAKPEHKPSTAPANPVSTADTVAKPESQPTAIPKPALTPDPKPNLGTLAAKTTPASPADSKPNNISPETFKASVASKPAEPQLSNKEPKQVISKPLASPTPKKAHQQYSAPKPKTSMGAPKLFISGRLPRKKGTSSRSLQLLHSIEEEMKQYCTGGDLVVLNYLIKLGLEKVKESPDIIIVDSETL